MTNEEIEKVVEGVLNKCMPQYPAMLDYEIAQAIREAVTKAYQECALIAEEWASPTADDQGAAGYDIGERIRALKDSLND